MAIFSTTHKTRILPPSDATMTNFLLINIKAKSSHCAYGCQVVLDLHPISWNPADVQVCNQSQATSFDTTGAESDTTLNIDADCRCPVPGQVFP